jgi:hypothetical protein
MLKCELGFLHLFRFFPSLGFLFLLAGSRQREELRVCQHERIFEAAAARARLDLRTLVRESQPAFGPGCIIGSH